MHVSDLPPSSMVMASPDWSELARALGKILGNSPDDVFYVAPIFGLPCSARLLSREKIGDGVCVNEAFPSSMDINVQILALELLRLAEPDSLPPARYSPEAAPPGKRKGWEIRASQSKGQQPIAIAYAIWV